MKLHFAVLSVLSCLAVAAFAGPGAARAQSAAATAPQIAMGTPATVTLTAAAAPDAAAIPDKVEFTVARAAPDGSLQVVAKAAGGRAKLDVPAGVYTLLTKYGQTVREEPLYVSTAAQQHDVVLWAGEITLQVINAGSARSLKDKITWRLYNYNPDKTAPRHLAYETKETEPYLVLPRGWYYVEAQLPDRVVTHMIEVEMGYHYRYSLNAADAARKKG